MSWRWVLALSAFFGGCAGVGDPTREAAQPVLAPGRTGEEQRSAADVATRIRWIDEALVRAQQEGRRVGPLPSGDPDQDLVSVALLRSSGEDRAADDAVLALAQAYPTDPLVITRAAFQASAAGSPRRVLELLGVIEVPLELLPGARVLRAKAWIATGMPAEGERALRELLRDPVEGPSAAFALIDLLTLDERFGDAIAVMAAVRAASPERVDLALVHARLLHDVWSLDEAARILDGLFGEHPDLALLALQRAELSVARGERERAAAFLAAVTGDDAFVRSHRDRVLGLQEVLDAERPSWTARDLLALVRGGEGLAARRQAFEALLDEGPLRRAAVAAALGQSEPILRVVAVRASEPMDPMFSDGLRRGLADPDPRVRGASARRLAEGPDPILALDLARGALRAEEDAYAFRAIHEAMTVLVGTKVELPPGGESDPTVRSKTREAWSRE